LLQVFQASDRNALKFHLKNKWTILEIANIFTVYLVCILAIWLPPESEPFMWIIVSFTTLLFWLRALYFMRPIVYFGWMVNMVMTSLWKAVPFMFVLLIIIMALTSSFNSYSNFLRESYPDNNSTNPLEPQAFLNASDPMQG